MKRKTYETAEDRANEQRICNYISKAWKCDLKKSLPYRYVVDRGCFRDGLLMAWIEIKCRPKLKYQIMENYEIGLYKIMKGVELSYITDVPFFLVVQFSDKILYYKCDNSTITASNIGWGGRTKTGRDDQDQEPMLRINIGEFSSL